MDRRGFLGSLLGSVYTIPFFARLESEEYQRVILPYRVLFKDEISGFTLQAPGVAEILKGHDGYRFRVEPLEVKGTMAVSHTILLTERGQVICENKFSHRVSMISGDTFHATLDIRCDVPTQSAEELVDLYLKHKRGTNGQSSPRRTA